MSSAKQNEGQESPPSPTSHKFFSIGKDCVIWPGAKIIGAENIVLGNAVMIDAMTFIYAKATTWLVFDDFVHIGAYTSVMAGEDCSIGAFTSLSWGVRVFTSTENLAGLLGPKIPEDLREVFQSPVRIGRHILIGANSVILPGAKIREGAVIGAGSVVAKNQEIPSWSIWGGVPAERIRDRDSRPVLHAERKLLERYYNRERYIGQV